MRFLRKLFSKKKRKFVVFFDRPRELKYDRDSFSIIEKLTGIKDINGLLETDIKTIPILTWAGLTWADPDLSKKQVRRMINKKIGSDLKRLGGLFLITKEAMNYYAEKTIGKKHLFSVKNPEYLG